MSRSGVEEKLPWRRVPVTVRRQVEAALGAPVVRGARIWGGYSPAPTFRLALADGRRAFFKAVHAGSNEFSTRAIHAEERFYHEFGVLLRKWCAGYIATIDQADWFGLLLEDLGPKSVPPWTPVLARQAAHGVAEFHLATRGADLPERLTRPDSQLARESWQRLVDESAGLSRLAALAGADATDVLAWLHHAAPAIERWMAHPSLCTGPFSLLHGDLRSDNLRLKQGRLYLFDWPAISVGRGEWDMVVFAQSITVEGGVAPEETMRWYGERFPVEAAAINSALAWWLVFFARLCWHDEIPGLPRLRRFQRQQFGVLAQWAARQWGLPAPRWTSHFLA